ncbi:MAG: site-2 protease family protein [Candidatus Firestonebacteria bacterium]
MEKLAAKIIELTVTLPAILLAITIHEYAHGWVANRCGDPTAKMMGRLTLNPLAHLDPIGAIMLLLVHFGWAKPVPVNFNNLRNPKRDMVFVSIAGPAANIIVAVISAIFARILFMVNYSIPPQIFTPFISILGFSVMINCALAMFNIIPIPPLDGSKILMGLLPYNKTLWMSRIEPYGFIILILLIMTGAVGVIMGAPLFFLTQLFMGKALFLGLFGGFFS